MKALLTPYAAPTLITEGSRILGDLRFLSETEIHGTVEGNVDQESLERLRVGKCGWVKGSVRSAGPVQIDGRVEGDVSSQTKIELSPTACVRGVLNAPAIAVAMGAIFEGEFQMKVPRTASRPLSTKKAA
jgi:cytoskeletal protein CcmA (bactofilin family)